MHTILAKLFAFLFNLFHKFTCRTNKLSTTRLDIFENYAELGGNIFAFWHSRLFYLAYYYAKTVKKRKVSILVSMSRDGDYGVAFVQKLKQDVVRGSKSKGGLQAIRKLADRAAAGNNLAVTPDGPKGPAFKVKEGVIKLAQLTGARIIPVSYQATRRKKLKSWDGFMVVKPFGHVHMAFAEPIQIPRDTAPDKAEEYRIKLENTLLELDRICAEELGLNDGG